MKEILDEIDTFLSRSRMDPQIVVQIEGKPKVKINQEMDNNSTKFELKANYYEIYNEQFNDLLSRTAESGKNLKCRSTPDQGVILAHNQLAFELVGGLLGKASNVGESNNARRL